MSDKVTLFGSNYSSHGDLTSNFLIKTKGKIKIQFGSKFVDLLNDKGELNADSKFIFKQDSVGTKDGIYLVGEDIILKVGDLEIKLNQAYDNIYVSFEEDLESDSELKYNALRNIGFIYPSLSDITEDSLKNGVIYVLDEEKFYIVKNGELTEFTIQFPNPYTKQFVISKNDESTGSLLILGEGKENSLAFPSFYLYSNNSRSYFDSQSDIYFRISDRNVIEIYKNQIKFNLKVLSDLFMSPGATSENGFRLFMNNDESTLEVDNLIVRNAKDTESLFEYNQIEYYSDDNLILDYEEPGNEEEDESEEESEVKSIATEDEKYPYDYILTLQYKNEYLKGDKLSIFTSLSYSHPNEYPDLQVNAILNCEVIDVTYDTIESDEEESDEEIVATQEIDDKNNYIGKAKIQIKLDEESNKLISEQSKKDIFIHRKVSKQSTIYLKRDHSNLELIEEVKKVVENEETTKEYVTNSRFGNLTSLKLKSTLDNKPSTDITGYGLYSKNAAFLSAQYVNGYNLPNNDNSSKFASTEWVRKNGVNLHGAKFDDTGIDISRMNYEYHGEIYLINGDTFYKDGEILGTGGFTITCNKTPLVIESNIDNIKQTINFPNKSGTVALVEDITDAIAGDIDLSAYVPINGDVEINGIKTFSETLKAKNIELTDIAGTYKVGNTSYKNGTIVNNSYTYTLPSSTGTLALTSDIVAQNFSVTLNKGIDNTLVINNNGTIDLSNLYNGSSAIPRVLAIITVTVGISTLTAQVNSGIGSPIFSVKAVPKRTESIFRDEISITSESGYYANIVGATAFIESLMYGGKKDQITKGVNNWSAEKARSQGVSFRISIPSNTSSSVYIQGIRTCDDNNDSIYYDSTYSCGIEKYKVVLFGYLLKK